MSKSGASAGVDQGGSCLKTLEEVQVFWLQVQGAEAGEREEGSVIFRELTRVEEDSELI